jgi:hypothetical protein
MTQSFTATEKHRAIIRELEFRRSVYPRQVTLGKMSPHQASEQIAIMEAIAADYAKIAEKDRLL